MYKILIVDDEPIVKIALQSILKWEEYGFEICGTASNGKEALQMIQKYNPHLVITDLKMPVMDGIELIRVLKNQGYHGEILVLSNYEDFEFVRNALVLGATDYLLKVSIDADTLLVQLKKAKKKLEDRQQLSWASGLSSEESSYIQKEKKQNIMKNFLVEDIPMTQFIDAQIGSEFLQDNIHYSLCYLSFDKYITKKQGDFSNSLIKSTLIESFQEYVNSEWFALDQYNILILLSMEDLCQFENLIQFVNKLSTRFRMYQSLIPAIIYEWDVVGFEQIRSEYQAFLDILKLQFYGDLVIENAKEIVPIHYISFVNYKDIATKLHHNGEVLIKDSVKIINDIKDTCKKQHVYPEIIRMFFVKILEILEFFSKNMTLQIHDFLVETREIIRFCSSSEELLSYMEVSLNAIYIQQEPQDLDKSQYKEVINLALEYIEENYQQKITLTSIARYVNFSSNYLCKSFKNEVGINITSYINNLRMVKAGEMLKQQDSLVKEVSINVGIDDQLYFSRLFKKYFGMTPSEYKNIYI